jgi:hypothetical protein
MLGNCTCGMWHVTQFFAAAGSRTLSAIQLNIGIPIRLNFGLDWRVSAFTFTCALAACIVVGIVPTFRAYRADPKLSLYGSGRTIAAGRPYLRKILVIGQLAASMILLVVPGLFVRSLQKVSRVTLGFDPHQVLNFSMDAHEIGYNENEGRAFYKDLAARVGELPGVRSASLAFSFPTSEYTDSERVYAGRSSCFRQLGFSWVFPDPEHPHHPRPRL